MIERYTIRFGPAVSQKELKKALHEAIDSPQIQGVHKRKARIDIFCDYQDLYPIDQFMRKCKKDSTAVEGRVALTA